MSTSQFIAGLIGPTLLAVGLIMLVRREFFLKLTEQFTDNLGVIFIAGLITLVCGLAIVQVHNVWSWDWPVIITIFGWLAIIGGLFRMALPDKVQTIRAQLAHNTGALTGGALISIALGAFLAARAFDVL